MRLIALSLATSFVLLANQSAWAQDPGPKVAPKPADKSAAPKPKAKGTGTDSKTQDGKTVAKKDKKGARRVKAENATISAFKPFEVGDQTICDRFSNVEIKMSVVMQGQPKQDVGNTQSLKVKRVMKYTGAKNGKINEIELQFLNRKQTVEMQDPNMGAQNPLANQADPYSGKTYTLSYDGKEVTVTEKNPQQGGNAQLNDLYLQLLANQELGTFKSLDGGFAKNVPARELKVDETFVFPETAAKDLMDSNMLMTMQVDRRQLIYKGTAMSGKTKCAVFDLVLACKPKNANAFGAMSMTFKGRVYIDLKTKRTLEVEYKGTLDMNTQNPNGGPNNPNAPQMKMDGSGTMEGLIFYTHTEKATGK